MGRAVFIAHVRCAVRARGPARKHPLAVILRLAGVTPDQASGAADTEPRA
jgi:hypothetical protein